MDIKEAYKVATTNVGYTLEEIEEAKVVLLKSLGKLEQLEIANKNNEGLVRENVELINRILKLQDDYQKLKEKFKKRAELCSEFAEYNRQYEKVLDFLIDKFNLELKGDRLYFLYNNQYLELDKEKEKLMKETFGYE